ncbi:hypothetical protein EJ08DRAFT_737377 [Tothia fuscella]|uniref:Nudix hydrolase domain-containing protein n=1 Tax=Tothia fuscella TaxID=1048955 RepID=A0A9P4NJP2_9PEZI|nr:hypothetical protein EJ08DRAFT_737377 [Tothia fuscella]
MTSPKVGVGVFLFEPSGKFIIGKRKGSLGAGTYALPGGHLELGETFEHCAAREVLEETGISIDELDIRYLTAVNSVFEEGQHYVTIAMGFLLSADTESKLLEPDKCEGWESARWEDVRDAIEAADNDEKWFQPMIEFVTQRPGFDPFRVCLDYGKRST